MKSQPSDICQGFSELPDDELVTREVTALTLKVKTGTLANWACAGNFDLPIVMVGRLPRYRVGDIRSYISRNRKDGTEVDQSE